ncbi:hypothetical protein DERF_011580 [Dermatophagoides farinae]|uniref:Uncharacterized protein n=1 Tax=Dermatophagoides farinae TaxID=6954 RepID=A0A922HSG6_DERFA|nr:hypothetical protein DERF_011580 [Dermatophagoides farinae]
MDNDFDLIYKRFHDSIIIMRTRLNLDNPCLKSTKNLIDTSDNSERQNNCRILTFVHFLPPFFDKISSSCGFKTSAQRFDMRQVQPQD